MTTPSHALIATFALVFLRAFQQQNVAHRWYGWAVTTSYAMAVAEVGLVLTVVDIGWPAVPWVGTGGAIGVVAAIAVHRWLRQRPNRQTMQSKESA